MRIRQHWRNSDFPYSVPESSSGFVLDINGGPGALFQQLSWVLDVISQSRPMIFQIEIHNYFFFTLLDLSFWLWYTFF